VATAAWKYFVSGGWQEASPVGLEFQFLDDEKHPDAKLGVDGGTARPGRSTEPDPAARSCPGGAAIAPRPGPALATNARIVVTGPPATWSNWPQRHQRCSNTSAASAGFPPRGWRTSKFAQIPASASAAKGPVLPAAGSPATTVRFSAASKVADNCPGGP